MAEETQCEDLIEIDGAILSVHVRNFFCHDNLDVKFNKNVNFIVGRNGSGKSAVLTALVVGLGGRATATNRGSRLLSFIKKGSNSATVEIKIKNCSPRAYKPELYGDCITVIRTLNASGGTAYKIKNTEGHIVSTKAADVASITTALDIQVDNPICILNQDEARNFHAADAKRKYLLYRKATNLELTESNYNKTAFNCEKAAAIWAHKNDAFVELEKELKKWELRYEQMQSREEIHQKQMKLQDEYYWSEIVELEQDLEKLNLFKNQQNIKIQKLTKKGDSLKSDAEVIKQNIKRLNELSESLSSDGSGKDQAFKNIVGQLQTAREKMKEFRIGYNRKRDILRQEDRKVKDLKREITAAAEENKAHERATFQMEITDLNQQLEEMNARKDTLNHELNQTRGALAHHQTEEDNLTNNQQTANHRVRQYSALLREADVKGKEGLAVYGRKMVELVDAVKKAHDRGSFSKMPRGPVGSYLQVKDKKWSGAIEHIIGGSLLSFCVNNAQDSRTLFSIMNKIYGTEHKPSVTNSKFFNKIHDVSKHTVRPPRGFSSALECVKISDPVIANFLIDNVSLETILMVPTDDDAFQFCDNIQNVPVNCKKIVTLDGSEYYPPPNYRSYGGAGRPSRFLQVSTLERKTQLELELSKAKSELEKTEVEVQKLTMEKAALSKRETELNSQLHKFTRSIHSIESKLSQSKSKLKDSEGSYVNVLVEELRTTEANLLIIQEELEGLTEKDEKLKSTVVRLESEINAVKSEMQKNRDLLMTNNEEMSRLQMKLDRSKSDCQTGSRLLREEQDKLEAVSTRIEEKKDVIDNKMNSANQLSSRISNPRKKDIVIEDLKKIQAKIQSITKDGPSKQEIQATLVDLQKKHLETKRVLQRLSSLIEEIKKTSQKHLQYCQSVQTLIARRVQYCFQSILTLRGYSGSMDINHGKGVLEIKCTGRDAANKRHANTTSSLSGGERSYSTVAFIMALWECVEMPFYFMDEFDVFMDNINRKIVMDLLVAHALKNYNRQFVFLTPQDASSVLAGPNIKIHRMADPVRSATAVGQ